MANLFSNRGLLAALLSFVIWGLFPIYWKLLDPISSVELLYIRVAMTAVTCLILMPLRGTLKSYLLSWKNFHLLHFTLLAALMLSVNWFSFIWAVTSGNILESSLGYFLSPIATVLLGRFILKEAMSREQWCAVIFVAGGVLVLIQLIGRIPLAALMIAASWSSYGLLKKRSSLGPMVSLGLETSMLSPFALVALLWMAQRGSLRLEAAAPTTLIILLFCGIVTASPLLLFAYAAPRIRLGTLGMGQYIVPSFHFILAFIYGESFDMGVLSGFALIWTGLAIYALSGMTAKAIDPKKE